MDIEQPKVALAFVIVFLFLLLFIFIYGITRPREEKEMNNEDQNLHSSKDNPTTKICPFCKSEVPIDATACRYCGKEISKLVMSANAMFQIGKLLLIIALFIFIVLGIPMCTSLR